MENMKKKVILVLCLAAIVQLGWAQNTVESIRQRYAGYKEYIATHNGDNQYDGAEWAEYYHVEARQFLPGTGGHKEDLYMYWDEREEEKIYASHYIVFAKKKYNFSAVDYYEEYMFDPDGNVAFIYASDPMWSSDDKPSSEQYEFRFYLNKGKLINAVVKKRTGDNQPFTDVYSGSTLKKEYEGVYNKYMGDARQIRQLFINIEKEAYNYDE